ncbi:TPA: JAB domain-containing protein [Enterobacter kobei]
MMEQSLTPLAPVLPLSAQRTVQHALALLDRHLRETGVAFTSTQAARDWLKLKMAGLEREEFMVLYLNQQNRLIAHETLFAGSISSTEVHPREVVKRALYFNAAAVILAHNHPSGDTSPSKADKTITQRLVQALQLVDIRVLDQY